MYYNNYKRSPAIIIFFLVLNSLVFAQNFNSTRLFEISDEQATITDTNKRMIEEYLLENGFNKRIIDLGGGKQAVLRSVSGGVPQYVTTYNLQARKTTGVEYIQSPSGLNLNIKGNGITIGVWDGGQALQDHIEFGGRLENKNGAEYSNHATHVSGTIIAAGINENAMGMAPEGNIINYYAFEDDLGPMANEAANGLILSNHSYGAVLGWSYNPSSAAWQWFGGDGEVDERFGYYSNNSRTIDEITYNAPYYTIVWAAGNDRSDVGDGSKAGDGPYDILGPSAVSKNVITVGAITGFNEYVDQSSIVMSSFSSWGPTDDGRIKPDIVADGVGLLSTSSSGIEAYTSLSGTSMASPNVTGTLAVLQEYYKLEADTFLTSALLKSLIIHSAREAGSSPGPDVQFGWGVLNAVDALTIIKDKNLKDTLLIEGKLVDQDTFAIELFSNGVTPIKATLAWTDYPGTPGSVGTDNIMLKNDLDIRLIDDEGTEVFPWMLDPTNPLVAIKGDNIRDNIEKIEFLDVQSRRYTLLVTHKKSLVNLEQSFGLTVTGGTIDSDANNEFYWISSSGNFIDSENWSVNSDGSALTDALLTNSTIVFDNNSQLLDDDTLYLLGNLSVENFVWLNDNNVTLDLGGDTLTITGQFKIDKENLKIRNGTLIYNSEKSETLQLNFEGTDNCTLLLDVNGSLEINTNINLSRLVLQSGNIEISNKEISISTLEIDTNGSLFLADNDITINNEVAILTDQIVARNNLWKMNSTDFYSLFAVKLDDVFEMKGDVSLSGVIDVRKVINVEQSLQVNNHLTIDSLVLNEGSTLSINEKDTVEVNNYLDIFSSATQSTFISGNSSITPAVLKLNYRKKLCFDYLYISNLELEGDAIFNAGLNSQISNADMFQQNVCDEVLYPDFSLSNNCSNSIIKINNLSEGIITTTNWTIAEGGTLLDFKVGEDPEVYFSNEGIYEIGLTIENETDMKTYLSSVVIDSNKIAVVKIVENSNGLISSKEGDSYQWYRDGVKLEGDTSRNLVPTLSGSYQLVYYLNDATCKNRISEPMLAVVTGIESQNLIGIDLYPNPFFDNFRIKGAGVDDIVLVYDMLGSLLIERRIESSDFEINMGGRKKGIYLVRIIKKGLVQQTTLLKI